MADTLPTVWPAEPHTIAKHAIFKAYLQAWAPILSQSKWTTADELLLVDGFSGPGEYSGGEPGSPVVALRALADHQITFPVPVRLLCIESRSDRCENLRKCLEGEPTAKNCVVEPPRHGECEAEVLGLIEQRRLQRRNLGPALFFLDQFGYSQVPMTLIAAIMKHEKCEIFSYMNFLRLNHTLADVDKAAAHTAAFGDERWRGALSLSDEPRRRFLLDAYTSAIKERAGVRYVWPFAMFDTTGKLIHWLIFSTNSKKGLMEMKKAMKSVDRSGGYRFSDRENPAQGSFFSDYNDDILIEELAAMLKGRTVNSESEFEDIVLTRTHGHVFKNALRKMRKAGIVTPAAPTFPIRFAG